MNEFYFVLAIAVILILGFIIALVRSLIKLSQSCKSDNLPHDWLFSRPVPNKNIAVFYCTKCGKLTTKKVSSGSLVAFDREAKEIAKRLDDLGR